MTFHRSFDCSLPSSSSLPRSLTAEWTLTPEKKGGEKEGKQKRPDSVTTDGIV